MIEQVISPFESTVKPFCDCSFPCSQQLWGIKDADVHDIVKCRCGEQEVPNQWEWDDTSDSESLISGKNITFHPTYSSGTAIVRGNEPLKKGMIHYWEVRVLTMLSGTDQVNIFYL